MATVLVQEELLPIKFLCLVQNYLKLVVGLDVFIDHLLL